MIEDGSELKDTTPLDINLRLAELFLHAGRTRLPMDAWPCYMRMGLLDAIKNIAQSGREIAYKTFVDHGIEVGSTAMLKLLPPKFIEQNVSGKPPRKSKNHFTSCVMKFIKSG